MSHAAQVKRLLRALLKAGQSMPDATKRSFVRRTVRLEYEQMKTLVDATAIREAMLLGETQLDSIRITVNSLAGTRQRVKIVRSGPGEPWSVDGLEFLSQSDAVQHCEARGIDYQVVDVKLSARQHLSRFD